MTVPDFSSARYLAALLRGRLTVTHVNSDLFPRGRFELDEVVTTHRLILVRRGHLLYQVDGAEAQIKPGQQIFVPAWTRRMWRSQKKDRVEFAWFEFSADETDDNLHTLFWRQCRSLTLEMATHHRLARLWRPGAMSELDKLQIEGEAKAVLARFWPRAKPLNPSGVATLSPSEGMHPDLKLALSWLHENFLQPEAIQSLYHEVPLSPNHFRLLFRRIIGCSPQEYLHRLRLRRARHLVRETDLPLKQVAAQVGFQDPLFFSRQYHRFWGQSPRQDRSSV